jgi:hypothetical protein
MGVIAEVGVGAAAPAWLLFGVLDWAAQTAARTTLNSDAMNTLFIIITPPYWVYRTQRQAGN